MNIPPALLAAFPPAPNSFLDRVRDGVDNGMLTDIAEADHGIAAPENFKSLRLIRDTGVIPVPLDWHLDEALTLTRSCDPEKPNRPPFRPGPVGRQGHHTRLFACAVLLCSTDDPEGPFTDGTHDFTLARAFASAKILGGEANSALGCYLTWFLSLPGRTAEPMGSMLGLLAVAARLPADEFVEIDLGAAVDWVLAAESRHRNRFSFDPADPRPRPFPIDREFRRLLVAELEAKAARVESDDVRLDLELCILFLRGG